MNRWFYLTYSLVISSFFANAQNTDSLVNELKLAENELSSLQAATFRSKSEAGRIEGNKQFISVWDRVAANPKIIDYPFTSLRDVSILNSGDGKFRLVTWNLHKDDGTHIYFGYLFANNSRRVKKGLFRHTTEKAYEHFKLLDRSMIIKNPETYVGTPDKWFGMLYTQLVDCGDYYTLIGWDGNDKLTQRKFVDVLSFRSDGTPLFGKDVFRFPRKNPRRLMFEYSGEVSMSLKYNEKKNQIIYSHLASKQEGEVLEGQYQFYGPDGSFDALEQKKGKWIVIEDVDARNEKNKNDNSWNNPNKPGRKKKGKVMPDYSPK